MKLRQLVYDFFGVWLTEGQTEIVYAIANPKDKRVVISTFTRYGKSYTVAMGVLIYIYFNDNKKINLIAPRYDQTAILRNYIAEFAMSPLLADKIDIDKKGGVDRLKKEVSRKRITFKNGCELRILSAEGSAERLMGWGGDLIVMDESCLIDGEVYRTKISRMMGDSPDSKLVEIGNPWHRNNQMWEHWTDPEYKKIHVGWERGIKEGRIAREFVDQQMKDLTPMEFEILYGANFPEEAEGSLLRWQWIEDAKKREPTGEPIRKIISCDIAEAGLDYTVLTKVEEFDSGEFWVHEPISWHIADTMITSNRIFDAVKDWKPDLVVVDSTGVGKGVADRLQELITELNDKREAKWVKARAEALKDHQKFNEPKPVRVNLNQLKVGTSPRLPRDKQRFANKKAQMFWTMRDLFEEGKVCIPDHRQLVHELRLMQYELGATTGKIKIIDPEKSPDYADSLCYAIGAERSVVFGFV